MYKYACMYTCVAYTYNIHTHTHTHTSARASIFPVFLIYNFCIKYNYKLGARLSRFRGK